MWNQDGYKELEENDRLIGYTWCKRRMGRQMGMIAFCWLAPCPTVEWESFWISALFRGGAEVKFEEGSGQDLVGMCSCAS